MKPDFISFYCGMLIGTGNTMIQACTDESKIQGGICILCLGVVSLLAYLKFAPSNKEK